MPLPFYWYRLYIPWYRRGGWPLVLASAAGVLTGLLIRACVLAAPAPLLEAVIGWGSDELGVPVSRAARDHPRVTLWQGWSGHGTYFSEESWPSNATRNHTINWIAANLQVDFARARPAAIANLRDELRTGVQWGETGTAIYSRHWHASRAVIAAAALEARDQELYDLAMTTWALQLWLEEATEAPTGPRAGESRRASLRTGDPTAWDAEGDHLRHLILREPTDPQTERRVDNARRALAAPRPPDAAGRARWLNAAIGAGSYMETFVVEEVLARHPEIRVPVAAVDPPRVRPGEYVVRRYERGVESLFRGQVRVGFHGLPIYHVRQRFTDGLVETAGWPDMVGRDAAGRPDFKAGLRIQGDLTARHLPPRDLGRLVSETVLGPSTPEPRVLRVPLSGVVEPEPDDCGAALDAVIAALSQAKVECRP